jgi:16S rRNA U516 pseudouridylate synthase RsuA-like enzyme
MTAHVGFPTLRLIRKGFGSLDIDQLELEAGKIQELTQEEAYQALRNS